MKCKLSSTLSVLHFISWICTDLLTSHLPPSPIHPPSLNLSPASVWTKGTLSSPEMALAQSVDTQVWNSVDTQVRNSVDTQVRDGVDLSLGPQSALIYLFR